MGRFSTYNGLNTQSGAPFKGPQTEYLILEHESSGLWPLDSCRSYWTSPMGFQPIGLVQYDLANVREKNKKKVARSDERSESGRRK